MNAPDLAALVAAARACRVCAAQLPLGPRPILRVGSCAPILIVGQAPGTRVHESGIPWDDASGLRLRAWLALEPEIFYDQARIAILPMGLCYPGRNPRGGDNPPRPECGPLWHPTLRAAMDRVAVTLLVGRYAQAYYLGARRRASLTETVRAWRDYGPEFLPLPHPSWRNTAWLKKNPWFEAELLPVLREKTRSFIA